MVDNVQDDESVLRRFSANRSSSNEGSVLNVSSRNFGHALCVDFAMFQCTRGSDFSELDRVNVPVAVIRLGDDCCSSISREPSDGSRGKVTRGIGFHNTFENHRNPRDSPFLSRDNCHFFPFTSYYYYHV